MISFVKSNLTQDFSNNSIDLRFCQVNVDVSLIFRYGTAEFGRLPLWPHESEEAVGLFL